MLCLELTKKGTAVTSVERMSFEHLILSLLFHSLVELINKGIFRLGISTF